MKRSQFRAIINQRFDGERALYASDGVSLVGCSFDGPADGESALKESKNLYLKKCFCNLRYPFWHDSNLTLEECELTPLCRAALWYSSGIRIRKCRLNGIKALRECRSVRMKNTSVLSPEFGWSVHGFAADGCDFEGEYCFLRSSNLVLKKVNFKGKYSFQYTKNVTVEDSTLDTKDAFWHAKNVTLKNCTVKGEYLAWYSDGLTLKHCRILGTQPFCYCKNLRLIDCEMVDTDLSFEKSEVQATLTAPIVSIKNPRAGVIRVPAAGEIVMDDPDAAGQVVTTKE